MAAWVDIQPGDRVYLLTERVLSVEVEYESNVYGSGKHRTGRLIVTTKCLGMTSTHKVLAGGLVHTDDEPGCLS